MAHACSLAQEVELELNRMVYFIPVKSLTPELFFTPEEFRECPNEDLTFVTGAAVKGQVLQWCV